MSKKGIAAGITGLLLVGALGGFWMTYQSGLTPLPAKKDRYIRLTETKQIGAVLQRLENEGVIRSARWTRLYGTLNKEMSAVNPGTFKLHPGMTAREVFASLKHPIHQMVRLREGWWVARQGGILEKNNVCTAADYAAETAKPDEWRKDFPFIAKDAKSLEGYLFPDTYDFPPEYGAQSVIRMQLETFKKKVLPLTPKLDNLQHTLTVASMVELEAAVEPERGIIAGVIENRVKKKMKLEIDATVLYALQKWYVLPPGTVKTVISPYNTYLHAGLPPGPIGSPGLASIKGALAPTHHNYLYYVALPTRTSLFAATYDQHLKNIIKARAAAKKASESSAKS